MFVNVERKAPPVTVISPFHPANATAAIETVLYLNTIKSSSEYQQQF